MRYELMLPMFLSQQQQQVQGSFEAKQVSAGRRRLSSSRLVSARLASHLAIRRRCCLSFLLCFAWIHLTQNPVRLTAP